MVQKIGIPTSFGNFNTGNLVLNDTGSHINVWPTHRNVRSMVLTGYPKPEGKQDDDANERKIQAQLEINLVDAIARVAELNGVSGAEVLAVYPAILRMLGSNSDLAIKQTVK